MRTDIHKPSTIEPLEYDFVALGYMKCEGIEDVYEIQYNRNLMASHREATGATWAQHEHGGNCQCCGAHCLYTAIFWHRETNKYIRVGMICAEKMDMGDAELFKAFRKGVKNALECKAGKNKARAILIEAGIPEAIEWSCDLYGVEANLDNLEAKGIISPGKSTTDMVTLRDIVGKIVKYGNPSEKQINFLVYLVKCIKTWKERQAKYDAERAKAKDCPTGRVVIVGTVMKTDIKENDFGVREVMMVKHDEGWLVWGSIPRGLYCDKGDKIEFTATITASDTDSKFGFYKRPSKASMIEKKESEELVI